MLDIFEPQTTDQLGLARQDGKATNQVSEHVFISNRLNKAWKDKRFPKSIAPKLTGLIKRARVEGISANLEKVLYALFKKCTRSIIEQSELFRLNFAIDGFKRYGRKTIPTLSGPAAEVTINYVITDEEKRCKFVCFDPHDIPVIAVIDPDMMSSRSESGDGCRCPDSRY